MGEPALLRQPVLGPAGQVGDRVPGEELGRDHALGGLLGDGLGAVLAELGELAAAVLLGPRAARAVEAVPLVEPGQRQPRSAPDPSARSPRCSDTTTALTPAASCSAPLTSTRVLVVAQRRCPARGWRRVAPVCPAEATRLRCGGQRAGPQCDSASVDADVTSLPSKVPTVGRSTSAKRLRAIAGKRNSIERKCGAAAGDQQRRGVRASGHQLRPGRGAGRDLRLQRLHHGRDAAAAAEVGVQVGRRDHREGRQARPGGRRRRRLGDEGLGAVEGRHALRARLLPDDRPDRREARQLPRAGLATARRWPSSRARP